MDSWADSINDHNFNYARQKIPFLGTMVRAVRPVWALPSQKVMLTYCECCFLEEIEKKNHIVNKDYFNANYFNVSFKSVSSVRAQHVLQDRHPANVAKSQSNSLVTETWNVSVMTQFIA